MAISEQEVFEAADQIRESGNAPSAIRIREITQTGSLGTIQKFLRKWRHRETVSAASSNPPPEQVLNSIRSFGEQLWHLALQQAEKGAAVKVRQARDELDASQRDCDEAMELLEQSRKQSSQKDRELESSQMENAELKKQLQQQLEKEQQLAIEARSLEQRLEERNKQQKQLISEKLDFETQLLQCREEREYLQAQNHSDREKIKSLEFEQGVLQERLEHKVGALEKAERQQMDLSGELENLKIQQQALRQNLTQAEKTISTLRGELEQCSLAEQSAREDLQKSLISLESERQVNHRLEQLFERLKSSPT